MFEKAMKSNKSIILLRSFLAISMVAVLVFSCVPFSASAEVLDTSNYFADILTYYANGNIDGRLDESALTLPLDGSAIFGGEDAIGGYHSVSPSAWVRSVFTIYDSNAFVLFPSNHKVIIDLNNISAWLSYYVGVGESSVETFIPSHFTFWVEYTDYTVSAESPDLTISYNPYLQYHSYNFAFVPEKEVHRIFIAEVYDFNDLPGYSSCVGPVYHNFFYGSMEPALYIQVEQLSGEEEKLEDIDNKLDKLPGNIGDEMQGIIDNEKEQSKGEGNKFVDQILDALPDPSTDVLAALKSLTDATAYTGTDAVLPIPAIVLPGIEGLFPETVIWEGTNFDFGEYLGFIPSSLLTLVQSLFTIAIVLFCVYELKGIISYCLTLRENKGG